MSLALHEPNGITTGMALMPKNGTSTSTKGHIMPINNDLNINKYNGVIVGTISITLLPCTCQKLICPSKPISLYAHMHIYVSIHVS